MYLDSLTWILDVFLFICLIELTYLLSLKYECMSLCDTKVNNLPLFYDDKIFDSSKNFLEDEEMLPLWIWMKFPLQKEILQVKKNTSIYTLSYYPHMLQVQLFITSKNYKNNLPLSIDVILPLSIVILYILINVLTILPMYVL